MQVLYHLRSSWGIGAMSDKRSTGQSIDDAAAAPPQGQEALAEFWDARVASYDRAYDAPCGAELRARQQAVLRLLGDRPGQVLDAGMGPGRLLAELQARGWRVAGVDISEAMVEAARRRLPQAAERLQRGSIERLPFAAGSFDAAVATGVLEYAGFRGTALRELARVLRPGGLAVASVPNPRAPGLIVRWGLLYPLARRLKRVIPFGEPVPPPRPWPPGPKRFARMLSEVGLEPEAVVYGRPALLPPPLGRLWPRLAAGLTGWVQRRNSWIARQLAAELVYSGRRAP